MLKYFTVADITSYKVKSSFSINKTKYFWLRLSEPEREFQKRLEIELKEILRENSIFG